jgi:ubiquinone/menaquinone biosynthesis C-methylase UbiE
VTDEVTQSMIERFNARARDYDKWWAPVLAETARTLIDYVEWYAGGPPPDGSTVLELGTGSGTLAAAVLERWPGTRLIATDVAGVMLETARQKTAALGGERVSYIEAPAAALPIEAGSIDLVVSSFVLQLVPDRLAALREGHRLLRPGGVFSYVTWIAADDDGFLPAAEFDEAVLDSEIDEDADGPPGRGKVAGDLSSANAAAKQLRKAGFRDVVAREDELAYDWTYESYLDYKFSYDESDLIAELSDSKRQELERRVQERLSPLAPESFHWRTPVAFAAARKSP